MKKIMVAVLVAMVMMMMSSTVSAVMIISGVTHEENIINIFDIEYGCEMSVISGETILLDSSGYISGETYEWYYYWEEILGVNNIIESGASQYVWDVNSILGCDQTMACLNSITYNNTGEMVWAWTAWVSWPSSVEAGEDQNVLEGETVQLDASETIGAAGYLWTQVMGSTVSLSDTSIANPTFVTGAVDGDTTLKFQLQVIKKSGYVAVDYVTIYITDNGISDFEEDVTTAYTSTSRSIGFKAISGGAVTSFDCIMSDEITDLNGKPVNFPYGLLSLTASTNEVGGTFVLTFYLDIPVSEDYTWYKYNETDGWVDFSNYATFNNTRDEVTITLVDGGIGDDDGIANGIIVDPSGVASMEESENNSSSSSSTSLEGTGGCFISSLF